MAALGFRRGFTAMLAAALALSCSSYGPYRDLPLPLAKGSVAPLAFSGAPPPESVRMLVLSDLHGYDRESLVRSAAVWDFHLLFWGKSQDTGFLGTAKALEAARVRRDLDLVLLPGDLTVDGELASHRLLADILAAFAADRPDLPVLVAPGNHDVNSPQARRHGPVFTLPAKSLSPSGFAALYGGFGYDRALARDPSSLSYVAEPRPGLVFLVLDTAAWERNRFFPIRLSATRGMLRDSTLAWIEGVLATARRYGKLIVVAQHHPPELDQDERKPTLEKSAALLELYARYGVALVVAGHKHSFSLDVSSRPPLVVAPSVATSPGKALLVVLDEAGVRAELDPLGLDD